MTADPTVARIEAAFTTLVRRARLPASHERMAAAAGLSLDRAGYVVLVFIGEWGPLRLSDLAHRLGLDVSTASRHVKRLEEHGCVCRASEPSDGRVCLLSLTDAGEKALHRIRAARQAVLAEIVGAWPARDRQALARLLERLLGDVLSHDEARDALSR